MVNLLKKIYFVIARDSRGLVTLPVFRTFWSIFLVAGAASVVVGGFVVICASPLANHRLYRVGGALLLCGGKYKYVKNKNMT